MIGSIIIIVIALYWLMRETDWLRIRLTFDETIAEYDARILGEMEIEWIASGKAAAYEKEQAAYKKWLEKRYAPKPVYLSRDYTKDYPEYDWMHKKELQAQARNGEAIYQRSNLRRYW